MDPLGRGWVRAVCFFTTLTLGTILFVSSAAAASISWSGPVRVDPEAAGIALDRVACPSTTQCTAVDGQGRAVTFNPQAPHSLTTITVSSQTLSGVACPTTTQCTTIDINGQEVTFNPQSSAGGTSTAIDPGGILLAIACPSASLCTTVDDNGQAVTFNPQSSQTLASGPIDQGQVLVGVDCPGSSVTKCAAIDSAGGAVLFNPQSPAPQAPTPVDPTSGASPTALTCRATECVLVDNVGTGASFDTSGSQPSGRGSGPIDQTNSGANAVSGVSCPSDSECVGVDVQGGEATFSPTLPVSAAVPVDPGQTLAAVACPDPHECVGVDRNGQEVTFDPSTPQNATRALIDSHTTLSSLSCPTTRQCTAVDVSGAEVTFVPGSSAAPSTAHIDSVDGVFGVACPRLDECVAVDNSGQEVLFDPQSPGSPASHGVDNGHALFGLACANPVQCTAVDDAGREVTFNPYSVGRPIPATIDSGHGLLAVACPSQSQCTAVDDSGAEVTFNPQAPGRPIPRAMDRVGDVALTCPNTTQCTAVDPSGDEVTFNPQVPTQASAENIDGSGQLTAIACRTVTACVAVDQSGRSVEGDPRGTGAWTPRQVSGSSLAGVNCPAAVTCVAIDTPGNAFLGSGGPLPPVPSSLSAPAVKGLVQQSQTVMEVHARWTNGPTSYTYQWQRCTSAGRRCRPIRGATTASYRLTRADVGHRLRVQEAGWNITGAGRARLSRATAVAGGRVLVSGLKLSGVSRDHPVLKLGLRAGRGTTKFRRIIVSLPGGLRTHRGGGVVLSSRRKSLGFKSSLRPQRLTLTLRKPASPVSVLVGSRALSAASKLVRQAKRHVPKKLQLAVVIVQRDGGRTQLSLTLIPR